MKCLLKQSVVFISLLVIKNYNIMEQIISQLREKYSTEIKNIAKVEETVIAIELLETVQLADFAQSLKDHLLELIDELTILKVNIVDANGKLLDSFATNQ